MGSRLQLHQLLKTMGAAEVYFNPPDGLQMKFPAIVYSRDYADYKHAGDKPYHITKRYQVTIIDQNPDSEIPDKVAALPLCLFNRYFKVDNLNHDVYSLYF